MQTAQFIHPALPRAGLAARQRRRGMTAMLAMLFLVLFSALAVGFYAAVTMASQVSGNDQRVSQAYLAAESGMDFMRFQLARVSIPPGTPQSEILTELEKDLKEQLHGTANFAGKEVKKTGNVIQVPANLSDFIVTSADRTMGFRATITDWAGEIVVKVEGRYGNTAGIGRAFQMDFTRASKPTTVFDFAVASKGKVAIQKGTVTGPPGNELLASIMSGKESAPAIAMSGGTVGGNLTVVGPGLASITGGKVRDSTNAAYILSNYVKKSDEKPEFPVVDTTVFKAYATNTYTSGTTLKNVRIPAGTNPKFTGGATIQGILYVESPNTIDFRGNVQMQGMIVFENKGTPANNVIDMRGNFSHLPLPNGAEFDALRSISGIAVMAPTTSMVISGSVDSVLKGNVILGQFRNGGSADWTIDQGTLMTLDEPAAGTETTLFNGKTVKFLSTGTNNQPTTGLVYSSYFKPKPVSYQEVTP
jgi:hypothetical protein